MPEVGSPNATRTAPPSPRTIAWPPTAPEASAATARRSRPGIASAVLTVLTALFSLLAISVEIATRGTAGVLWDPFPTTAYALLALAAPLGLLAGEWLLRRERPELAAAAFAVATVVNARFGIVFAPAIPIFAVGIALMGAGLLGFAPYAAVAVSAGGVSRAVLAWRRRATAVAPARPLAAALALALLVVALLDAPRLATHVGVRAATSDDAATAARGLAWLRLVAHEDTLLRLCYTPSRGFAGSPQATEQPSRQVARRLFFQVTGAPFSSMPRPVFHGETGIFADDFQRTTVDQDLGGNAVAGRVPDLALRSSAIDVSIAEDASTAMMDWTLTFANASDGPLEARTLLALPAGAVGSRLSLWIDGEEREAAYGSTAAVRAAYQEVAVIQRRDPALLTWVAPDRLLLQCFPVPAHGEMKVKVGITAPLQERGGEGLVALPAIDEMNVPGAPLLEHAVWVESRAALRGIEGPGGVDGLDAPAFEGGRSVLRGTVSHPRLTDSRAPLVLRAARRPAPPDELRVDLPAGVLVGRLAPAPEGRRPPVVLVVDASASMTEHAPRWREALAPLAGRDLGVVWGADVPEVFDVALAPASDARLESIARWLEAHDHGGGHDPVPGLLRARELTAGTPGGRILWVHGAIPELAGDGTALEQACRHAAFAIDDFQVAPGPNRLLEDDLARLASLRRVPRLADPTTDLAAFLSSPSRERTFELVRPGAPGDGAAAVVATATPAQARLAVATWAASFGPPSSATGDVREVVQAVLGQRIVTPFSGAVVLEQAAQYEAHGLEPARPQSVPSVPEPGTVALLLAGGAATLAARRRREARS